MIRINVYGQLDYRQWAQPIRLVVAETNRLIDWLPEINFTDFGYEHMKKELF